MARGILVAVQQLHYVCGRVDDRNRNAQLSRIPGLEAHAYAVFPSVQSKNPHLVTARQKLESKRIPGTVWDAVII